MKLNKMKIARLTDDQAKKINGGGTNGSTRKNFTCCWCSGGGDGPTMVSACGDQNSCGICPTTDPSPTTKEIRTA